MIKWILFDQAGVQNYPMFTTKNIYTVNGKNFSAKDLEAVFYTKEYDKYSVGKISEKQLVSSFLGSSKLDLSYSEFVKLFKNSVVSIPGIAQILEDLKKKYKLAILTNEGVEWLKYKFYGTGFKKFFDKVITSAELYVEKPDIAFY